jgi:hypothetical protein
LALDKIKLLIKAEKDSLKACETMRKYDGSSRARSTTLNADWCIKSEYRERCIEAAHVAVVRAGLAERWADENYGEFVIKDQLIIKERP